MKANVRKAMEYKKLDAAILCCYYTAILVLNGRFGFGKKRLQEFTNEFSQTMADYFHRYDAVTPDALQKHVKEKGIEVDWI
jgi:hypothetical protein